MFRKLLLGGAATGLIWSAVAAQTPPTPSLPLTGSETVTCIQSGVPKGCTTANIAAAVTSGAIATALGYTPAHNGANTDITSLGGLGLTAHGVVLGNTPISSLTPGTAGYVLSSGGSSANPSWLHLINGTPTTGDCVSWAGPTLLGDTGSACGGGGGGSGTVTTITAGTGLTGGTITTSGTIALASGAAATNLGYTPLAPANNLSDVSSASNARTNLGVSYGTSSGTVAQGNDSRFAGPTQNSQSAAYTFVIGDAGGEIYHPSADTTARTWTIPTNASVAYAVGVKVELVNDCSAGAVTLQITSDTLEWFPTGATGTRMLAACSISTITKITTTKWVLTGAGVS